MMGTKETIGTNPPLGTRDFLSDELVETYLGSKGIGKQVGYASFRGIPYAVIQGPDERALGQVAVKDLVAENQTLAPEDGLAQYLLGIVG